MALATDTANTSIEVKKSGEALNGLFWIAGAVALAGIAFAWAWGGGQPEGSSTPLPVITGTLPDFTMTNGNGQTVTRDDFTGQIWVANFVFTRCPGPCPKLSERMRALQYALGDFPPHVQLVSFTLDPENDRPPALQRYGKRYNADPSRWSFLTNDSEEVMYRLIAKGFLQTVIPATSEDPLTHSNYFVLLDGMSRIRGFYDGLLAESKKAVLRDIRILMEENSGL